MPLEPWQATNPTGGAEENKEKKQTHMGRNFKLAD